MGFRPMDPGQIRVFILVSKIPHDGDGSGSSQVQSRPALNRTYAPLIPFFSFLVLLNPAVCILQSLSPSLSITPLLH